VSNQPGAPFGSSAPTSDLARASEPGSPPPEDGPPHPDEQRLPDPPHPPHAGGGHLAPRRRRLRIVVAALVVVLLLVTALTVYLFQSARAWQDRAADYLETSLDLGEDLAATRSDLAGATSELEAVRGQLSTATQRITELADEKAQLRDESEIQQQLVSYQERVSDAAGQVALALDLCVQGQNRLIGYQKDMIDRTATYDPDELEAYRVEVQELCDKATEANIGLQRELSR
jgi:hypothetical protein